MGNKASKYVVNVGSYSGNAGDSLVPRIVETVSTIRASTILQWNEDNLLTLPIL